MLPTLHGLLSERRFPTVYLLCNGVVGQSGLVAAALLLELHVSEEQGGRDDLEDRAEVLVRHSHDLNQDDCVYGRVGL